MRMLSSDLEPQTPEHRLSAESQFSAIRVVSRGCAASLFPIYAHSFERQPTNETVIIFEEKSAKSETVIVRSLNSIVRDGFYNVSMLILTSAMHYLSFARCYSTFALSRR
jgi:hypothetical protein